MWKFYREKNFKSHTHTQEEHKRVGGWHSATKRIIYLQIKIILVAEQTKKQLLRQNSAGWNVFSNGLFTQSVCEWQSWILCLIHCANALNVGSWKSGSYTYKIQAAGFLLLLLIYRIKGRQTSIRRRSLKHKPAQITTPASVWWQITENIELVGCCFYGLGHPMGEKLALLLWGAVARFQTANTQIWIKRRA